MVCAVETSIPDFHSLIALYVHLSTFHDFDPLVSTPESDFVLLLVAVPFPKLKGPMITRSGLPTVHDMGPEMVNGVFWRTQSESLVFRLCVLRKRWFRPAGNFL